MNYRTNCLIDNENSGTKRLCGVLLAEPGFNQQVSGRTPWELTSEENC